MYEKAVRVYPAMSVKIYNQIGIIWGRQGNAPEAIRAFQNALKYHAQTGAKEKITGSIYLNLGTIFNTLGRTREARENFTKAVEQLRIEANETSNPHQVYARLGNALMLLGDFKAASEAFRQAMALNPDEFSYYHNLANALYNQNRIDDAINVMKEGVQFMSDKGQTEAAEKLKQQLGLLENLKSNRQN
jgi:tetratricopeptide (TPR) repeat protein